MTRSVFHITKLRVAGAAMRLCRQVVLSFCLFVLIPLSAPAQDFFNLTAQQVKIDSLLPVGVRCTLR